MTSFARSHRKLRAPAFRKPEQAHRAEAHEGRWQPKKASAIYMEIDCNIDEFATKRMAVAC
jgi:hypothetical protein